jgi:hypothetical protein
MSRKFKRESADYAKHCRNKAVMRLTELPPSFIRSLGKYLAIGNRGYKNEVRLRGLLKPAKAGLVCLEPQTSVCRHPSTASKRSIILISEQ